MNEHPLDGLLIRSGVVLKPDLGFIIACDPQKEQSDIPHAITFMWKSGKFSKGKAQFNAHTCCLIKIPRAGWVILSAIGIYSVETSKGVTVGNIFKDSQPQPAEPLYGDFRSVTEIDGKAYAVGLEGMVYRLDAVNNWTRIDLTLPRSFDIEGIHGFDASDIYTVGYKGEIWHFNGRKWKKIDLPTNVIFGSVKCAGNGIVYAGGNKGVIVRGKNQNWEIINQDLISETIWDIEWFKDELYISTMSNVYRLKGENIEKVNFGDDKPKTTYQLSATEDIMWSIGRKDIMAYDGVKWSRIV